MNNFETIEIIVRDGQFKKIENHKWPIMQWERLERTWSYLRKKYGKFTEKSKPEPENDSWVSE